MNPETVGQIILVSLRIVETVIHDQPAEERRKAWERWYGFFEKFDRGGSEAPKEEKK